MNQDLLVLLEVWGPGAVAHFAPLIIQLKQEVVLLSVTVEVFFTTCLSASVSFFRLRCVNVTMFPDLSINLMSTMLLLIELMTKTK